ncbi:methyltransferase domain-containing protein [Lonsdalea populi]|uniref:Methyltransferase domain-containing protein n=2 Tax=Lonsdalea populi TaxID=1172565 RepID=A0A3N0UUF5_9GAMM|nr:methyltransferase domain-containing protein [Lonsdalea populi]
MSMTLQDLVSALPEVYQPIYGHAEWNQEASRDCNERLLIINKQYDALAKTLDRPLRVLDLGCAQGFFSLNLANRGATVTGIDFLQENIDVCRALAQENSNLDVNFTIGRIEGTIQHLNPDDYDFVIGLSVFHHIVYQHGIPQVKEWLFKLADSVKLMVLELAVKEEPLYWGEAQPNDPRELIEQCHFYHQVASFPTHLSDISRPMYFVSNGYVALGDFCQPFLQWYDNPYSADRNIHKGSRRYYFSDEYVCKIFQHKSVNGQLTEVEGKRNAAELKAEAEFLSCSSLPDMTTPKLFLSDESETESWLVMERLPGNLLMERLKNKENIDYESLFSQILKQLVELENIGLYHDDVRSWNIMISDDQQVNLIDYGSISNAKKDCAWPGNIFQSFFILVNEIFLPEQARTAFIRPVMISPFKLPRLYANWLYAFWKVPQAEWSFGLLNDLFHDKENLFEFDELASGSESWIAAQEQMMVFEQEKLKEVESKLNNLINAVTHLDHRFSTALEHSNQQLDVYRDELKNKFVLLKQSVPEQITSLSEQLISSLDQAKKELEQRLQLTERTVDNLTSENAELQKIENRINNSTSKNLELHQCELRRIEEEVQRLASENIELQRCELQRIEQQLEKLAAENASLQEAERKINKLTEENIVLQQQTQAILSSRSWRMTAGYRYVGLQIHLLRKFGAIQRGKHLVKRVLNKAFSFLRSHPRMKIFVINLTHRTGLYPNAVRVYQRLNPAHRACQQDIIQQHSHLERQLEVRDDLPPEVNEIYQKIKK